MIFPWGHEKRYNDYPTQLKKILNQKVRKLSVDAGFTCPNKDGSKAYGGCTYCNNDTFKPKYCEPDKKISQQLDEGASFFKGKGFNDTYLAYFQSFTNTYADLDTLKNVYSEALKRDDIAGLVIGTRPDCIDEEKLDYLESLAKDHFITVEYGLESTNNQTLAKINRCQTHEDAVKAINLTKNRGIHIGAHLMMGLPGEDEAMILNHADEISTLPINSLKLHQLQIVKRTVMAKQYKDHPEDFHLYNFENYRDLVVKFLERLNPNISVERFASQSPKDLLIAPKWGYKNFEVTDKIERQLRELDTWQGRLYTVNS